MSQTTVSREEAIKANIYVHAFLANAGEYNKSPHFRPENQEKVRNILLRLTAACREKNKVIDFGCGTGFMIHLMHDLFKEVHGADSIGPVILGLSKPVHVLQLGASVDEMVNMAAVAVVDAQEKSKKTLK